MKRFVIVGAVALTSLGALASVGGVAKGQPESEPAYGSAAALFSHGRVDAPMTTSDWNFLNTVLLQEEKPVDAVGPIRGELQSAVMGRSLYVDAKAGKRIAAVPGVHGETCFTVTRNEHRVNAGCVLDFPSNGVVTTFVAATKDHQILEFDVIGFTVPGVSNLEIETASGATYPVVVRNGAYWWSSPEPSDDVVAINWMFGGKHHSNPDLFKTVVK